MKFSFASALGTAVAGAIVMGACSTGSAPLPTVAVTPVPASASSNTTAGGVTASATVVPLVVSQIGFVVSAPVKQINVNEGDTVHAGQPLIVLDAPELTYAETAAQAALTSAQADEFIQSSGRKRWDGYKWVWAAGPPELRQVTIARTNAAQASLVAAQAAAAQATLLAPYDGTVVSIKVAAGEVVQPGQVALIIGDLAHLQVETTDLSERDIASVRLGQTAHVQLKAFASELGGKVVAISPLAGKSSDGDTVFKVTIALDAQPAGLLWGMTGDVRIDTK